MSTTELYAPKAAAKIAEAAHLIRKAARLLDTAGDGAVKFEIGLIEGSEFICLKLANDLERLADRLDDGSPITGRRF